MNLFNLDDSHRFILLAICFLVPVSAFILNWVLFFIGKIFWIWYLPTLRRNSKLRFRINEIKGKDESFLYVETGVVICFSIFSILYLLINIL